MLERLNTIERDGLAALTAAGDAVIHLGLDSYDQRALFCRQMRGSGGLFTFVPKNQDRAQINAMVDRLNVFQIGVSWGGFESLSVPITAQPMGWDVPTHIVRLYCGLEHPDDLIRDLDNALADLP